MTAHDVIDLTHPLTADMPMFPGLPGPETEEHLSREASRAHYADGTSFVIHRYGLIGNTGTYLDSPFHRHAAGDDLARLPLAQTVNLPGVILDATAAVAAGRMGICQEDLAALREPLAGHALLLYTGWAARWPDAAYVDPVKPYLSGEAAEVLLASGVALVGIDSWNLDDVADPTRPTHTLLLAAGIPIVENLANVDRLAGLDRPFRFFAAPLPFVGGSSIPVRAFALLGRG
jgi:kynurenine formamidase